MTKNKDKQQLIQDALAYHEYPRPGKLAIEVTKPTRCARDLSLAYTPGVAVPVLEIAQNPENAYKYTNKGNLVAVISNGTAILGLGNRGALASKPVMEGKAVLFKKFADIDVFDIELEAPTVDAFINSVAYMAPTFGGINLEDIKAPECFEIEAALKAKLDIPVFHDDQHGTAIVVAAGLLNALELQNKSLTNARIVCLGAGAAGMATMNLLITLGAKKEHIFMIDRLGVIHTERENLSVYKQEFANKTDKRTVVDAMTDADVLIGVSGPDLINAEDLTRMADNPIVFALSNPDPEIHPDIVKATRSDCIMATGRSDFPNQVNNVLCFPYMFRGTLDARAYEINEDMYKAAVHAIRNLAKEPVPQNIIDLYPNVTSLSFGADYLLPKPMDPRLKDAVSNAVKQAAIDSGAANLA